MPTQPTRLTHGRGAGFGQHVLDGVVDLAAALGDAAGAEADADLARPPRRRRTAGRRRCGGARAVWRLEEIVDRLGDHLRREAAVGRLVDLHHRGQRAAAEAGDLLDREQAVGVGVLAVVPSRRCWASASWIRSAPFTWQAVPWQTLDHVAARPAGGGTGCRRSTRR